MSYYHDGKFRQSLNLSTDVNCVIMRTRDNLHQKADAFFNPTPEQAIAIGKDLIKRGEYLLSLTKRRDELAREFTGYAEAEFWKCKIALRRAIDYSISLEESK